jgi:hypothetical protein
MKPLIIFILTFTCADISLSQPYCDFRGIDSLFIQSVGDTTNIWDLSLCAYCSTTFSVTVSKSNDSLFIMQTDTAGKIATCDCLFDQCTSITGLAPGTYWAVIHRALLKKYGYFKDTIRFIGAIQFTRPSSNEHYSRISLESYSLIWTSFQSACIPDFVPNEHQYSPNQFALLQNYPNPFNPSTTIQFQIPTTEYIVIKVFDILGREVHTLLTDRITPGLHSIVFNMDGDAPSGIYYYRMAAGSFRNTKRMIYMR